MPKPNDDNVHRLIDLATRTYAQEVGDQVSSHPAIEDLIALQEGCLEPPRADEIIRHLAVCPQCAEEVVRLNAFDGDPPSAEGQLAAAVRSWERFREAVESAPDATGRNHEPLPLAAPCSGRCPAGFWRHQSPWPSPAASNSTSPAIVPKKRVPEQRWN